MFFKDEEDRKEFHLSIFKDQIKWIERDIEYNKKMAEIYKGSICACNKGKWKNFAAKVKKLEVDLQEEKEKLKKAEEGYLTIPEKAARKGLTVIRGGLCENV